MACLTVDGHRTQASFGGFTNEKTKKDVWGDTDSHPGDWATAGFVTPATPPTFIGHSTGDTGNAAHSLEH